MPVKMPSVACRPVSLAEYVEHIEAEVDFRDRDSIIASAPMLQRLAANKNFFGDWLIDRLSADVSEFQRGNDYNYQSIVLRVTDDYLLRVNFWVPEAHIAKHGARETVAFGYNAYHNHNFNLLTVGYSGSGYATDIYRMREPFRAHEIGDEPDLEALGRWHLGCGEVMFYDAFRDVHSQIAPAELSVSINLMTHSARDTWPQYMFDAQTMAITGIVGSPLDARIHLLTVAKRLVPGLANEALQDLARNDPSPRLRKLAADALDDRFTDWR